MDSSNNKNTLFLIPVGLSDTDINWYLPLNVLKTIHEIRCFIAENAKTARQFLKFIKHPVPIQSIEILELDKHHPEGQKEEIGQFLKKHGIVGLMSEAGLPCIADPGSYVVKLAHKMNMKVRPLTGPSSILMALIASGLNGQNFRFNGYISSKLPERKQFIQKLELESLTCTQLFIEAPYRNDQLLKDLCNFLRRDTMLLLAIDLTGENEKIISKPVQWFRDNPVVVGKVPCMFGIGK